MYTEIGSFDAKTKLSALLQEVKRGQRYTITLHGHPIADLVPSESAANQNAYAAIESMRRMRKVSGVSDDTLRKWKAEGRR
jgi:prevent-host-death family protein